MPRKATVDTGFGELPAGAFRLADLTEAQRATGERMLQRSERRLKAAEAARAASPQRITTPYGPLPLGHFDVAEMDSESRETVARCLCAIMARMDAGAHPPAKQ